MTDEKIARISQLAQKSRAAGLTAEEKAEQAALRAEYLAAVRASLTAQLARTVLVDSAGRRRPLAPRGGAAAKRAAPKTGGHARPAPAPESGTEEGAGKEKS